MMRQLETIFEELPFEDIEGMPDIDVTFSGCRLSADQLAFDVINFQEKKISRWTMPHFKGLECVENIRKEILEKKWPKDEKTLELFWSEALKTHLAQISDMSSRGKLFVCTGNLYSGFCVLITDTKTNKTFIFPEDFEKNVKLYCPMGDFTPDNKYWLFVRWPLDDTLEILKGTRNTARCEVGRLNLDTLEAEIIYELDNVDNIHQITCSDDGRYIVFTPLSCYPKHPYPTVSMDEDPEGYRKSHEEGLYTSKMTTIDLKNNRHWQTEIPVPIPAHFEFDLVNPHMFYVSAHNFCMTTREEVVLEGPGAIIKMEIKDGETVLVGQYSDDEFFRVTQHVTFYFENHPYIAVTNLPDKLDIIDGENMELWHRQRIFPAPPLDFSKTGNLICPTYPESCYSISPSKDGRYLILESTIGLIIFDMKERRILEQSVSRQIPKEFRGTGHTRLIGK